MLREQVVPVDLADIPPGPQLSTALAGIDLDRLSGFDCVRVLHARYRQLNHDRAALMSAMVEVGLCGPASEDHARMTVPDEFSADEIRAALMLTRRAAESQFSLAYDLITRLPAVHATMHAGLVDEPRARVLSEWTTELSVEQARAVCDSLLARITTLTTGQLIEQIKKMALAIDPAWAQRRYEQAVAQRKVVGYRNPDGSANPSGYNLPIDRVAASCGHIDALAKAAKRAGDARPIDHIRADLFLGMTDGTYTGLDDAAILERLRASNGGAESAPDPEDQPGPIKCSDSCPSDRTDIDSLPQSVSGGAGREMRVRLSTLLGYDEYPGELAGWGPIHAQLARDRGADADHTRDHAHAGVTDERNLGHACRHDHRLKHDGGWRLDQPTPGQFRWISRLGHTYLVPRRPIIEFLPDPISRDGPPPALVISCHNDLGIWEDDPPERDTRPPPDPGPADDPPPF